MIKQQKNNIDLVGVVIAAGVELTRRGSRHVGLCPFHTEKTPSFTVFPDQRFKCFSCQAAGDCIDFVQKFYDLSFKEALAYLGIEQGKITPEIRRDVRTRKLQRQEAEAHKKRISDLQNTLLILISATHKAAKSINTIDDLERYGNILDPLPWWEYNLELLSSGTDDQQRQVCEQFKDMAVVPAETLFKQEFDYSKWLKNTEKNGEPNVECQRITISFG